MTYKVGPKGQVVIPKEIRDRVGLQPGDEVNVYDDDGDVYIRKARPLAALRGILRGHDLLEGFEAARREDRAREARKEAQWPRGRP